jgi:hypothetical protein
MSNRSFRVPQCEPRSALLFIVSPGQQAGGREPFQNIDKPADPTDGDQSFSLNRPLGDAPLCLLASLSSSPPRRRA